MILNSFDQYGGYRLACEAIRKLRLGGFDAMLVGGCVRDLLLRKAPEDFDVATSASPEQVTALFPKAIQVGAKFGVVVVVKNGEEVEIATFRTESGYSDRRRPDAVEFSDARSDALRRDFTINGLYMVPDTGEIIDYIGGQADLETRVIRAIGAPEDRFNEDALRMMRCLRLASALEFAIDAETWKAVQQDVGLIAGISAERIRDELVKGLMRDHPDRFLQLLDESGVLALVLPEVADTKLRSPYLFEQTKQMLGMLDPASLHTTRFATLLLHICAGRAIDTEQGADKNNTKATADQADAICRRLSFSNADRERVVSHIKRLPHYAEVVSMTQSKRARFLAIPDLDQEIEICRVGSLCGAWPSSLLSAVAPTVAHFLSTFANGKLPAPLVTGDDLLRLGQKPGPRFRDLLNQVYDAQLEGRISQQSEALTLLGILSGAAT